jgi:hypothetical protein
MPLKTNSPNPAETLENFAATKGLKVEVTEPFTQTQGPRSMNVPEQFTRMAFRLSPEEPMVSEPVQGEDAFYIVSYKQKIPSELPPLDVIRDRVVEDYKRSEALTLARQAANPVHWTATVRAMAVQVYKVLRCEGLARVDFFFEEHGRGFLINEVNTMPGFTPISMYPKMWQQTGMTYPQLVDELIDLAVERHHRRRRNTKR